MPSPDKQEAPPPLSGAGPQEDLVGTGSAGAGYPARVPRVADRPAIGHFQRTPEAIERAAMAREFWFASFVDHRNRQNVAAKLAALHASVLAGRQLDAVLDDLAELEEVVR